MGQTIYLLRPNPLEHSHPILQSHQNTCLPKTRRTNCRRRHRTIRGRTANPSPRASMPAGSVAPSANKPSRQTRSTDTTAGSPRCTTRISPRSTPKSSGKFGRNSGCSERRRSRGNETGSGSSWNGRRNSRKRSKRSRFLPAAPRLRRPPLTTIPTYSLYCHRPSLLLLVAQPRHSNRVRRPTK